MKPTLLLAALIALSLSACGSGGSTPAPLTDKQKIAALETSGDLPTLDRTDTIGGIDANANGVRDDIEAIITKKYTQLDQRAAAMQKAKALQAILLVDPNDKSAVKAASLRSSKSGSCLFKKFNPLSDPLNPLAAIVSREIESLTTNTKKRLKAYLAYGQALDGSVLTDPQGDTCE